MTSSFKTAFKCLATTWCARAGLEIAGGVSRTPLPSLSATPQPARLAEAGFLLEIDMSDIELAREAAAKAQVSPTVKKMILSGTYDAWPNVQGALNAVRMAREAVAD